MSPLPLPWTRTRQGGGWSLLGAKRQRLHSAREQTSTLHTYIQYGVLTEATKATQASARNVFRLPATPESLSALEEETRAEGFGMFLVIVLLLPAPSRRNIVIVGLSSLSLVLGLYNGIAIGLNDVTGHTTASLPTRDGNPGLPPTRKSHKNFRSQKIYRGIGKRKRD